MPCRWHTRYTHEQIEALRVRRRIDRLDQRLSYLRGSRVTTELFVDDILALENELANLRGHRIALQCIDDEYRRRELEIKKRAVEGEVTKAWVSGLATSVPIVVALFALAGTIWAAKRTVVANFTAKAADWLFKARALKR